MVDTEKTVNNTYEAKRLMDLNEPIEIETLSNLEDPISNIIPFHPEKERFAITKWVIFATIGFIFLFLIGAGLIILLVQHTVPIANNVQFVDPLDRLIKVYLEIIPFWATITGTILGYHFIKKDG